MERGYEKRQEDRNTRDIAVKADTKVDTHMQDCLAVRQRIEDSLKDIRTDLKRINWLLPLLIGGIMVIKEGLDLWHK